NESKRKCRQYSVKYLKFGFISVLNTEKLPMCLLCERVFSNEAMKPSRLSDHLKKIHPDKMNQSLPYFQTLRDKFRKKSSLVSLMAKQSQKNNDELVCSYNISKLIARSGKPLTISEQLLLPVIEEVLQTVVHHAPPQAITKSIPFSNNSVQRRVDEIS
ncbi:hypothetical protein FHG87_014373, partial [Trinorchestia longiramus]